MEYLQAELDEEACWQAVLNRDESNAGLLYGVRSTQIFCRPSCPSRRPNREQVCFFHSVEAATAAGFRPCKRCQPEQSQTAPVERVEQACRLIEANLETPLSLAELSQRVGSTPHHFQRTFKQITGVSPREYSDALRLKRLKAGLHAGETVLNARVDAGYGSNRGLYERADAQLGMTPATYQRGGKGAQISFGVAPCSLGFLLVAATTRGICSVTLGDSPQVLKQSLREEFPRAEIQRDDAGLQLQLDEVLRFLHGRQPDLNLPLDVQATAFQWKVWQALQTIGYGETRSYAQVAQSIRQPAAVRAVARACATNPVALVVPCHRVVRGDGSLSGYRWGVERKRKLLRDEREHS